MSIFARLSGMYTNDLIGGGMFIFAIGAGLGYYVARLYFGV